MNNDNVGGERGIRVFFYLSLLSLQESHRAQVQCRMSVGKIMTEHSTRVHLIGLELLWRREASKQIPSLADSTPAHPVWKGQHQAPGAGGRPFHTICEMRGSLCSLQAISGISDEKKHARKTHYVPSLFNYPQVPSVTKESSKN